MRSLEDRVGELIAAGVPALWIESFEHEDAVVAIKQVCVNPANQWKMATFDVDEGMMLLEPSGSKWVFIPGYYANKATEESPEDRYELQGGRMNKLDTAILSLPGLNHAAVKDGEKPPALLVLKNVHRIIDTPGMIQLLANSIWTGNKYGRRQHLVFLSPVGLSKCPYELRKLIEVGYIEHELPDRAQLQEILEGVAKEDEMPKGEYLEAVLDASGGLTRLEAENAFALSLVRHQETEQDITKLYKPETIFEIKAKALKTTASLSLYEGSETFQDVGGLDYMKAYASAVLHCRDPNPKFYPRGLMIMGVSGSGKSLFAKALGREVGRPTLCFDVGATLGSLMGQSQSQFRQALKLADAMAPCILFLDEVEKALSGAGHDARTSGGVKTEMFGYFLTWLQEHRTEVYVICTCNDIRKIIEDHPEFVRRFDRLFFVDFPDRRAKDRIWDIHLRGFELLEKGQGVAEVKLPTDDGWTGAEIENCCRQARLLRESVSEIGKTMPRIIDQASETIAATRQWAEGRCYAAEYESLFKAKNHKQALARLAGDNGGPRRKVRRRHVQENTENDPSARGTRDSG